MTTEISQLRTMDLADILDRAVDLYRRDPVVLLGVYAVGYTPFWLLIGLGAHFLAGAVLEAASPTVLEGGGEAAALRGALGAATLIAVLSATVVLVEPLVTGAMARAVADRLLGRPASIRTAYAAIRQRKAALILSSLIRLSASYGAANLVWFPATLLMGVAVDRASWAAGIGAAVLGLAALLAGGLIFVYLLFIGQVVVVEQRGTAEAVSRSWRLVSGRLWRTSAAAGFLFLLTTALAGAVEAPLVAALALWAPHHPTPEAVALLVTTGVVVFGIASLVASPVMTVGSTLMYFDLRVGREGLDVELLAASLPAREAAT